jgi:peptidyl-prolyl cis-trans isomerase B (cyclophilin B)
VKAFYVFFIVIMIASMGAVGLGNFGGTRDKPPVISNTDTTPAPTGDAVLSFPDGPAPVIDATQPHVAVISTNKGDIKVDLATDAPEAVNSFAFLAGNGFYNDTAVFYVNHDYFAQGGDPNCAPDKDTLCTGTGGPDYTLKIEPGGMKHDQWVVVAPAVGDGENVHGSQFRILYQADPRLDGTETVFGRVTDEASREVLESLSNLELCTVLESNSCAEGEDFTEALVIKKVTVQPA